MTMKLSPLEEECLCFTRNLTSKELKEMSQFLAFINSSQDFAMNLKKLSEGK